MTRSRTLALAVGAVAAIVGVALFFSRDGGGPPSADPVTTTTVSSDASSTSSAPTDGSTTVVEPVDEPLPPDTAPPAPIAGNVASLEVGDCFSRAPDDEVVDVTVVSCEQPHTDEVYTVLTLRNRAGAPYPADLDDRAEDGCYDAFVTFVGVVPEESDYAYDWYVPSEAAWAAGERRIPCVATEPDGKPTSGSASDAR